MHTRYTISGSLYHLPTQQILLNTSKQENDQIVWTIVEGKGVKSDAQSAFKELIKDRYGIELHDQDIYSVYDYVDKISNLTHYVFYGLVNNIESIKGKDNFGFSWFTFKKAYKLKFKEQVHHDIIITQRVINAHSTVSQVVESVNKA